MGFKPDVLVTFQPKSRGTFSCWTFSTRNLKVPEAYCCLGPFTGPYPSDCPGLVCQNDVRSAKSPLLINYHGCCFVTISWRYCTSTYTCRLKTCTASLHGFLVHLKEQHVSNCTLKKKKQYSSCRPLKVVAPGPMFLNL